MQMGNSMFKVLFKWFTLSCRYVPKQRKVIENVLLSEFHTVCKIDFMVNACTVYSVHSYRTSTMLKRQQENEK